MSRYLIVFYGRKAFYATEMSSDIIDIRSLCDSLVDLTTPAKIKKVFGYGEIAFKEMTEVNDYFNNHPELDYLIINRENKKWYFRRQGEYVFQPIESLYDEVSNKHYESDKDLPEVSVAIIDPLEERVVELETQLAKFKSDYQQNQKYETYIFIGLLILIAVVGIIALFY